MQITPSLGRTEAERGRAVAELARVGEQRAAQAMQAAWATLAPPAQPLVSQKPVRQTLLERAWTAAHRIACGMQPDTACAKSGIGRLRFRRLLREHVELGQAYRNVLCDHLRREMDEMVALADQADALRADDDGYLKLQALKLRLDTRMRMAERLLDEFQPKQKNENTNIQRTLTVVTGVPQRAAVITASVPTIEDLL